MCSVNATSALLLKICSVYHRKPWFCNASAIQNCTALLWPLHLLCSLPTSLVLTPQLCPVPCSCPAVPFFQLCQSPFLSISTVLLNFKLLIFTKLIHCNGSVSFVIFHRKYPADTKQKIYMASVCLEVETQ